MRAAHPGNALLLTTAFALLGFCGSHPAMASAPSLVPLDLEFGAAPTPVRGEERDHLLYEMRVTNFSGREITLKSVDVADARTGAVIARHQGDLLASMIGTPGRQTSGVSRLTVPPGGIALIYFDTALPAGTGAGRILSHTVRIAPRTPDEDESRIAVRSLPLPVGRTTPRPVGPPLRGAGWLAANALSNDADHRRTVAAVDGRARIAQRYAIDFVQLDRQGRAFSGDPSRNESWTGYGAPVLAVADGTVEVVRDGLPDNTPLAPPAVRISLDTIGGNAVVIALAGGQRVFYGHLKLGSIHVRPGQKVKAGQRIAMLGNSGQSDAPHLHLHVADGPSALGAEGLAFAFRSFKLQGHVPSLDVLESPKGWQHPDDLQEEEHHLELPLENAVIAFPE